jgi:hypothetical protein
VPNHESKGKDESRWYRVASATQQGCIEKQARADDKFDVSEFSEGPSPQMIDDSLPADKPASTSAVADVITELPKEETPEEQMARFEDALKEEDWGHQPC